MTMFLLFVLMTAIICGVLGVLGAHLIVEAAEIFRETA